jgi:HAE1 family hydrophobic/amphiphilic exporter-1
MTVTELSIKRPVLIIVIFTALTLLGYFGYRQLKYEMMPNVNIPMVTIMTLYPGASANQVESAITKKIEDAVSGMDKVDNITSTSAEGYSMIVINLTAEANVDFSLQDAQRKVNQILSKLPSGARSPSLSKVSFDDFPIITIGATNNMADTEFYQFVKNTVAPRLSRIAGVGLVNIIGAREREIQVNIDTQKLQAYNLSASQILQSIQAANLEFPAGNVKDSDNQYVVRLAGKFQSIEDLRGLVISKSRSDGNILLSNVAEIQDSQKDPSIIARINGKDTLSITVQKQSDANAVDVSRRVHAELRNMEKEYQKNNLQLIVAIDTTTFTVEAVNAVMVDLAWAILLVAGVMLVFLHSFRNSIIVMVAIPTSLVSTFIGMWAFGFTLNVISLLALSLVIGILVDDAIVVLENIYRHLEMGKDKRIAALQGRNEIGFTAVSITMVDIVVYGPLALVTGMIGGIMRQFSMVIVVSTLMSLFVSFTITPLLASRFSRREDLLQDTLMGKFGAWFEKWFKKLVNNYEYLLRYGLNRPVLVLIIASGLFLLSFMLPGGGFIGSEMMPQADQSQVGISIELPPGSKLEKTNFVTQDIERIVSQIPEVETLFTTVGSSGSSFIQSSNPNTASLTVKLKPKNQRSRSTEEVCQIVKTKLANIPGAKIYVSQPSSMGGGGSSPIQFAVSGPNWDDVSRTAEGVKKIIAQIPGTGDVRLSSQEGVPEMKIEIDRKKLASFSLSMMDVAQTLQIGLAGNTDSKFQDQNGNEYDINIRFDQFDRSRTADIGNLTVANRMGQLIQLNQFATITPSTGPTKLERRDRNYSISVGSQAIGKTAGTIGSEIRKALAKEKFPSGVTVAPIGSLKMMMDSFLSLLIALLAALIFVYLIMAALYNSFIYPLAVMFSVPLAIIGAFLGLALTRNSLAIFAIMGIIMLVGLVSKNAILLVDFTNKRREEGLDVKEALVEAGRERIRPILMTTLTMIFGMLPLAMASAAGSEFKRGLGWVLIGGLTSSMLMTLVVIPVVYMIIDKIRVSVMGERANQTEHKETTV